MAGIRCPKCNQIAPARAALCLACGALLPRDAPAVPEKNADDPNDPWRPSPFPPEVGVAVALIGLGIIGFIASDSSPGKGFGNWLLGGCILILFPVVDGVSIIGLVQRSVWGWWIATLIGLFRLMLISAAPHPSHAESSAEELGRLAVSVTFVGPAFLLLLARVRGAYFPRMAGERKMKPAEPVAAAARQACKQCGDPCPDVQNIFTRAGVCSKKCLEREA